MVEWSAMLVILVASFSASALLVRPLIGFLRRRAILDIPNERSSHVAATPKGAGIVVLAVILIGWVGLASLAGDGAPLGQIVAISSIAAVLGAVSWIDDLKGLSPLFRLLAHIAAAGLAIQIAPFQGMVFQGLLNAPLDAVFAAITWVWFINLFNFMDGIDGISGAQSATICVGVMGIGYLNADLYAYVPYAAVMLGASAGFLVWNWPPAKIFLGDVGSAPLGFLLGWILLSLAAGGHWAAALILPAYYLTDATITLILRAVRGEKVWRAHREHFYQKATSSGLGHGQVTGAVAITGLLLAGYAAMSEMGHHIFPLAAAIVTVLCLLFFFSRPTRG